MKSNAPLEFVVKRSVAIVLVAVNGAIVPLLTLYQIWYYLADHVGFEAGHTLFPVIVGSIVAVLLINIYLITARFDRTATVLSLIGGALTFPVGVLGIAASVTTHELARKEDKVSIELRRLREERDRCMKQLNVLRKYLEKEKKLYG